MGYVRPNPLLADLRGKVGDLYIAKYQDEYIIKKRPERKRRPATAAQTAVRDKLVDGNRYWKRVRAQPEQKAVYLLASKLRGKRACDLAKADFRHAPAVVEIDLSGYNGEPSGAIRIEAEDDFEVIKVLVRLLELEGTLIEEGEAALDRDSGIWTYLSQGTVSAGKAIMVEVTATDRPGNNDIKRVDHVCGPR